VRAVGEEEADRTGVGTAAGGEEEDRRGNGARRVALAWMRARSSSSSLMGCAPRPQAQIPSYLRMLVCRRQWRSHAPPRSPLRTECQHQIWFFELAAAQCSKWIRCWCLASTDLASESSTSSPPASPARRPFTPMFCSPVPVPPTPLR